MKSLIIILICTITINLSAQTKELTGTNGFNFGMTKEQVINIIKTKAVAKELSNADLNTLYITQKVSFSGAEFTGAIFHFSNNKLYGIDMLFAEKNYSNILAKITEKYGNKFTREDFNTNTYHSWSFNKGKAINLSIDRENKQGMLQFTDPNLEAPNEF